MASGLLGTAITGLVAFQRSLETTSHNISNVNTEGYSRQRVELATKPEQFIGVGYMGKGVKITDIARSYDQFVTSQLRSSTSAFGDVDRYNELATQMDEILADPSVGMAPAIKEFFNAVNDAADDPASLPAREVMLSESEILSSRFQTMNDKFDQIREQLNDDLVVMAEEITSLAGNIADLNRRIAVSQGQPDGTLLPNDLLDQRDTALNQLAQLIDVSVVPSNNNMINVFVGKGQVLVLDTMSNGMVTMPDELDASRLEIALKTPKGGTEIVTKLISGGELSGSLRFRDEILDPSQQRLGAVAAAIALEVNNIHRVGYDLDGNGDSTGVNGTDFFKGITQNELLPVTQMPGTTGNISVVFDPTNIKNIDYSDYQLDVAGGVFTLTRLLDNTSVTLTDDGSGGLVAASTDDMPGILISYSTLPVDGDSFLIRPTYRAASLIARNIQDPRQVALATNEATDSNGNSYYINGAMPGDNRNALALAALESKQSMRGGTASFQDAYGLVVSEVGTLTKSARIASAAQETLLNNAKDAWSNISGVNLDEEAANLIKFQQSYQAAAQVISVSNTLFDSILGAVR
jgi:flagellar hook-associated protein 1 FlgK